MSRLFILATVLFWIAVAVFWTADIEPHDDMARPGAVAPETMWTLAEVARHNKINDCWMAIDGTVYDLTAYLPQHPSNPAVILRWCGKEATEAYHTKTRGRPHSAYANEMLLKYRIGASK
ncbi:cytochrome b5-like heme/steroid binding domain-containing protein [Paraburkholderia sp. A3BS-1L]|uniref:cytochrome b5 domain-containing protein n=1 Tax=Paraburkholderia sp. A3BS-1L TaxID=3028375 RepID=UPI003DA9FE8F